MSELLFFRFNDTGIESVLFDGRGQLRDYQLQSEESFVESLETFSGELICVVPGEDVLLVSANVPSRQQRQILQAVPYAVEETLAQDVEDCVFALGQRSGDGDIPVAVVDRGQLESWIERLATLGIAASRLISENALVISNNAGALVDGDRVHLGVPGHRGFSIPISDLPLFVSMTHREDQALVLAGDVALLDREISELEASGVNCEVEADNSPSFQLLCLAYNGNEINLLQGEYKVEEPVSAAWGVWRSVAILSVAALFLHLAMQLGQGWYLSSEGENIRTDSVALYADVFPSDRNVRDIKRRWDSNIGRRENNAREFMKLFSQSARELSSAGLTLENVNFNDSRGDLVLQVTGERSEALVEYTSRLVSKGLKAEIGTINQEEGAVRGSIRVRTGRS